MEFGVCFKGELSPKRLRSLVRQLEAGGFDYCWFYDSHILWRDCYVAMAMCMEHTSRIRFGPCVTNPGVREWSVAASLFAALALQSEGRFDIGLGRGDSSLRVMGKRPANLKSMVEFGQQVKAMVRGEEATYPDCPSSVKFPWAAGHDLPLWIAAYGPKALKSAGEYGDGLILQIAEPEICRWLAVQARLAGEARGRNMSDYRVMAAAPAFVGPMDVCIEKTRWFPAMVGNHIAEIVERYGEDSDVLPKALSAYVKNRRGYDYSKHGQSDNPYLDFITPDVVESFAVLGSVEQHIDKLRRLEAVGVTQFNIYFENGDEEELITNYAEHIIPELGKKI